jgi:hypothetical protein
MPEPHRLSRAAAEALIGWLTAYAASKLERTRLRHPHELTEAVSRAATSLGLSELLAKAIDAAGKRFYEQTVREVSAPRPSSPRVPRPEYYPPGGSPNVIICQYCNTTNPFYIKSTTGKGGWICCPTPGCRSGGLIETSHNL